MGYWSITFYGSCDDRYMWACKRAVDFFSKLIWNHENGCYANISQNVGKVGLCFRCFYKTIANCMENKDPHHSIARGSAIFISCNKPKPTYIYFEELFKCRLLKQKHSPTSCLSQSVL